MERYTRGLLCLLAVCMVAISVVESKSSTAKNHELLAKLGLNKIAVPNTHHRKRLAVESRHHDRSDDSHMFIIKLPPNPHYYAHNNPPNQIEGENSSKKLPIGFKSNGKPGRIYHWNIPILKKIASAKNRSRLSDTNIIDIVQPKNWNEVVDKQVEEVVTKKLKKPSYYIPAKPKKSNYLHKYFPGNGKPHSFYVIEKSKKPHYHRLLP